MTMSTAVKHVTTKSDAIMKEAATLMPGGVSSPVRAFKSVGGGPVVFERVKGAYAYDVDGNQYVDYVGTWGPAICGHANDEVNEALRAALEKGTSFGAPSENENVLAKMVCDAVPSVEMVRFTNSGTEACMGMLRLVRAYTGREKIIKFEGCYHGHADGFLVQAGSGVATLGLPDSPGVPPGATQGTLVAEYNNLCCCGVLFHFWCVSAVASWDRIASMAYELYAPSPRRSRSRRWRVGCPKLHGRRAIAARVSPITHAGPPSKLY